VTSQAVLRLAATLLHVHRLPTHLCPQVPWRSCGSRHDATASDHTLQWVSWETGKTTAAKIGWPALCNSFVATLEAPCLGLGWGPCGHVGSTAGGQEIPTAPNKARVTCHWLQSVESTPTHGTSGIAQFPHSITLTSASYHIRDQNTPHHKHCCHSFDSWESAQHRANRNVSAWLNNGCALQRVYRGAALHAATHTPSHRKERVRGQCAALHRLVVRHHGQTLLPLPFRGFCAKSLRAPCTFSASDAAIHLRGKPHTPGKAGQRGWEQTKQITRRRRRRIRVAAVPYKAIQPSASQQSGGWKAVQRRFTLVAVGAPAVLGSEVESPSAKRITTTRWQVLEGVCCLSAPRRG